MKRIVVFMALAMFAAMLVASGTEAKPKQKQQQPQSTLTSVPGTITHTSYAADGVTVLSSTTTQATDSDSGTDAPATGGLSSVDECCSGSGCDWLDVTRDIYDWTSWDHLGTFHHNVFWCWDYPDITYFSAGCWSDVDGSFINDNGCDGYGWWYHWAGSDQGGHYSFRQANWENCFWWFGCFKSINPWIQVWVNANGAWAQNQGG